VEADCADLVSFLAYGGFRLGEAKNITWADCDFACEEIIVRGDQHDGTNNNELRRVPMIGEVRQLIERLQKERLEKNEPFLGAQIRDCLWGFVGG
jgi:integrase